MLCYTNKKYSTICDRYSIGDCVPKTRHPLRVALAIYLEPAWCSNDNPNTVSPIRSTRTVSRLKQTNTRLEYNAVSTVKRSIRKFDTNQTQSTRHGPSCVFSKALMALVERVTIKRDKIAWANISVIRMAELQIVFGSKPTFSILKW